MSIWVSTFLDPILTAENGTLLERSFFGRPLFEVPY